MTEFSKPDCEWTKEQYVRTVRDAQAMIHMLEAVQYVSQGFQGEHTCIFDEMRGGIDDNVISDLCHYVEALEEAMGESVPQPPYSHSVPALAHALESMTGLRPQAQAAE